MQSERKENMLVTVKNKRIILFIALIPFMLFAFQFISGVASADDHKRRESDDKRYEIREEHYDSGNRTGRLFGKEDDGNEVTGQTAAWLLVAANFTVVLSILIKGLIWITGNFCYGYPAGDRPYDR